MNDILHETVTSFNEYIGKLPNGTQYIADQLRANNIAIAMNTIIDFADGAKWLSEASELFEKNGLTVDFKTDKIHEFLEEINNGLEIQDFVLVADMFEYEIKPFFEECQLVELSKQQ